jgi:hypothetical protein
MLLSRPSRFWRLYRQPTPFRRCSAPNGLVGNTDHGIFLPDAISYRSVLRSEICRPLLRNGRRRRIRGLMQTPERAPRRSRIWAQARLEHSPSDACRIWQLGSDTACFLMQKVCQSVPLSSTSHLGETFCSCCVLVVRDLVARLCFALTLGGRLLVAIAHPGR